MSKHFNAVLIHTCTVQRPTATRSESGATIDTFATNETGVPCRLVRKTERFASEGLSAENVLTELLLVKATADIEVGDRVTAFLWASDGTSYLTDTYEVLNRLQRNTKTAHHAALELERIE